MVELILHRNLEKYTKGLDINFRDLASHAYLLSINAGFEPPSKFILDTCPDVTVCYDGNDGVPHIILDLYKLLDDNIVSRNSGIVFDPKPA